MTPTVPAVGGGASWKERRVWARRKAAVGLPIWFKRRKKRRQRKFPPS